ncbi:MAG: hypothetical protein P4L82_22780 [Ancalomicrobiaceae bacterium]|nr:hypothetical protein [Ancalomicrobiaceae bacterium]
MSNLEANAAGRSQVDGATAAFGLAAAITILFNTLLAWVKDAYDPLNTFMASLTGHHWRTHGIADVIVFLVLGFVFLSQGVKLDGVRLAVYLAGSCIIAGGGLALWFVLV